MASMFQTTLAVKTPPKGEPVSIVLARQHCRIDNSSDDALLAMYLTTARQMAEQYLSRALLTQTLTWTVRPYLERRTEVSFLRGPLFLPRAPVQSVSSVTALDRLGNATTIAAAVLPVVPPAFLVGYNLDISTEPAKLYIGQTTPLTGGRDLRCTELESVQVEFTAGYADVDDIPKAIINAILLTTGFLYENRGDVAAEMPRAAEWLLDAYRIMFVG
jgi:uncharacterized phiE125 gp8 family phage protein